MKMILVAARGEQAISLGYHLKPLGFTVEHFADPVRVTERLEEIDPQAIVFDAGDFPRHWKPLLKLARAWAAMHGRGFVTPDDIRPFIQPVLAHRVILDPSLWEVRTSDKAVIDDVIRSVPVPVIPAR